MDMNVKLSNGAIMPKKAYETDAGFDLYSLDTKIIQPHTSETFDTGVHVELPQNTVGLIKSKSGLNIRHGLVSEGVIDVGYTGSIRVNLYNHSNVPYTVMKGDKISQLVIVPIVQVNLKLVDSLENTERGNGGFGSTGKQ
jgi:dUTP pyrophosphatase